MISLEISWFYGGKVGLRFCGRIGINLGFSFEIWESAIKLRRGEENAVFVRVSRRIGDVLGFCIF